MRLYNSSDGILLASAAVTCAAIQAAFPNPAYIHADVRFILEYGLQASTVYKLELTSSAYTSTSSSFVGWCRGWDLGHNNATYSNPTGKNAPFQMDLFSYQYKVKGA